ncbi:MAG: hypothetical protein EZS28_045796, partial [Streblomastix strix]
LPPSQRVVAISPLLYFECVRAFGGGPTVRYPSKRCQKCDNIQRNHLLAIDSQWLHNWILYITQQTSISPGPITNQHLCGNNRKLKDGLAIVKDYRLVSQDLWRFLINAYGGGPDVRQR